MEVAVAIGSAPRVMPPYPFHIRRTSLIASIEKLADQTAPFGMEGGLLAVEIKIALPPGGERHEAFFVGQLQYDLLQSFPLGHIISLLFE